MKGTAGLAIRTGTQLAKAGYGVIHLKSALTDATRDPIAITRRMARRSQFAAEDFRDEMALAIRKEPFKAAGIALGAGLGIGVLIGWARRGR